MAQETVSCTGNSTAGPDIIWATVNDFARPWHPDIDWMHAEIGPNGQTRRRFATSGDTTTYLEQLTYISHSDRAISYTALEGIAGVDCYNAHLHIVAAENGGSCLTWRATINADKTRAGAIAAGTKSIFDTGLAQLSCQNAAIPAPEPSRQKPQILQSKHIGKSPKLAITVAPSGLKQADTLCIFLHGIGGERGNWDAQLSAMGGVVPSVALDLRGYGDSPLGAAQSTVDDYCADILAVAKKFKAQNIILCGLSYGAWIATSFAMRHSEKLTGLVLAGGCTGMSEATHAARDAFRRSREIPLDAGQTPADFAPDVVKIIAGPNASDTTKSALQASMAAIPVVTYRDALTCFTNPKEVFDFARISCPVLLMTGEFDVLAPPDEIRSVSLRMHCDQKTPDIQFEEIANAGHVCNLEQPDVFNAHLIKFLRKTTLGTDRATLSGKEIRRRQKHTRILDAALVEFSRNGFSGASMQAIATRAEVSKPTLYQYFGQKESLLAAVLDVGKSELLAPFENTENKPLVDVLWQFSWIYADFVLRPDMLSLARLIIGEAERLPDVAREYQRRGPLKALAGIVAYLNMEKHAGSLNFDDAEMAAQHLWSLILSPIRERLIHHPNEKPDQNEIGRNITSGLRVFLKAYGANPDADMSRLMQIAAKTTNNPIPAHRK